jgi:hypothetical protein
LPALEGGFARLHVIWRASKSNAALNSPRRRRRTCWQRFLRLPKLRPRRSHPGNGRANGGRTARLRRRRGRPAAWRTHARSAEDYSRPALPSFAISARSPCPAVQRAALTAHRTERHDLDLIVDHSVTEASPSGDGPRCRCAAIRLDMDCRYQVSVSSHEPGRRLDGSS